MKSWSENLSVFPDVYEIKEWEDSVYACPMCGGTMQKNTRIVLTSNPPQYQYRCSECGWYGTRFN